MNKRVELPLTEPLYKTYHYQGPGTAIICDNPTIRNGYLNDIMNLNCSRKFLSGFTTPQITIPDTSWSVSPYLDRIWMSTQFINGYISPSITEMLEKGFYVAFGGVDDYYIKGKTWYKERHFCHDGLICGYDKKDNTYCIYAYDNDWIYRKFWTPQNCFELGRKSGVERGYELFLCCIKAKTEKIEFSPKMAYENIVEYLDSSMEKYPETEEGPVYGITVHHYIAKYIEKLYDGSIPYERMDRRVFRLIWEHKKAMFERITLIEQSLGMNDEISKKYRFLVAEADNMRMLFAAHHMKRRDSVLPIIQNKLLALMSSEREILITLTERMKKDIKDEIVEVFEKRNEK